MQSGKYVCGGTHRHHLHGKGIRQKRKLQYKFVEQEAINSLTGGSGPEESGATQLMVLPGAHRRQVPPQSWHLFIRLQLSHPRRHQDFWYLLTWQSQIIQEQSDSASIIYYHSLEYWH